MFMGVQHGNTIYEVWPLSLLCFVVLVIVMYKRGVNVPYLCFLGGGWIYATFALNEVFFPLSISGPFAEASRSFSPEPQVNLVPLYFGPYADIRRVFISSVQNILLTIPFGFGINFLKHLTMKRNVMIAFLLGLGLEFVQYVISLLLGYAYRVVDVNDVLLNALGVVIGYGLFRLFARFYVAMTEKLGIEHTGLSAYIYDIAERA